MTERWSHAANDVVDVDEFDEGLWWLCPDCGFEDSVVDSDGEIGCEECGWSE